MHVILADSSERIGNSTALSRKYSSTLGAHVSGIISSPELETIDGGPDDGSTINVWLNLIEIASISIDDKKMQIVAWYRHHCFTHVTNHATPCTVP